MSIEQVTPQNLQSQLALFCRKQFTGKLDIRVSSAKQWSLYLSLGRLVWASGGVHPTRRWRRQLACHCPQVNYREFSVRQTDSYECWDYHFLTLLAKRRVINSEQLMAVIEGSVKEVLFDILQTIEISLVKTVENFKGNLQIKPQTGVHPSPHGRLPVTMLLDINQVIKQTQQQWASWVNAGLRACSPNWAPVLRQPFQLKKLTSTAVYKTIINLVNGQRTIRDLAMLIKQDTLALTRSLLPYIRQKLISFVKVPDLSPPSFANPPTLQPTAALRATMTPDEGLIACIDDSPQICCFMEELLSAAGYRFLGIQNPLQALPTLIKNPPDVILLDLIMPIANGYEICAQIRRVDIFEKTPIIIVTSNNGIIDRVRAKIVGATGYLTKPVEPEKVIASIRKHFIRSPAVAGV